MWKYLIGLLLAPGLLAAESPKEARSASIQNSRVRITYDLGAGTYDLLDLANGRPVVHGGFTRLEGWASTDTDCVRTAKVSGVTDDFGHVQRLTVKCALVSGPILITEFELHRETDSAVELRAGLENNTPNPIRLKEFHPLAGGIIGSETTEWTEVRTLNGDSACAQARVSQERFRSSANNLLLTFKQNGQRHSLVLGGLKTAAFTKWAQTVPAGGLDARGLALEKAIPGSRVVCYLDCGTREQAMGAGGPVLSLVAGQPYTFPARPGEERFSTIVLHDREIAFRATGLDPKRLYALGFSWWDYDANGRVQTVRLTGAKKSPVTLFDKRALPQFQRKNEPAEELAALLPAAAYADGSLLIGFVKEAPVWNAVVSELWLWELRPGTVLPADWSKGRPVTADPTDDATQLPVIADLEGSDPIGKLVEPGKTYLPADSFYIDFLTADPFAALERYGQALATATHAAPHLYDFPTVCAWYAGVWQTQGAQNHPEKSKYLINTTPGMVKELEAVRKAGFDRYTRVAGRLVPDTYEALNPQGWWDDAHWQKGGYYVKPYETSQKYGDGMHERGGLAFTYLQPTCLGAGATRISKDFREQHVDWLCGKDVERTLDYTHPTVQAYLQNVFGALRGHIDGVMVDYGDDLWAHEATQGGFVDSHSTSTEFYRMFFRLAKEGLGPNSWLHERNLNQPNNDLTMGLVDLQRTSWDTDKISPDMVSRSGLRWYKNRIVYSYDMDSKDLNTSWKINGFTGSDQDGRRMMLTMAYVAASRLLIANSFRDLSRETLADLSRTFPYPRERRSARPVDAFVHDGWPQVYDFEVNRRWHQVTLCNTAIPTKEATLCVPLSGEQAEGALGLDSRKEYYVYDFWNHRLAGRLQGAQSLKQTLRPGEARMLAIHEVEANPQFISSSRHLMQGYLDLARYPAWDKAAGSLHGAARVVGGETYEVVIALNGYQPLKATTRTGHVRVVPPPNGEDLAFLRIEAPENGVVEWALRCERAH